MAGADEDRDLAAEYVLGTLDADERAAIEARLADDVALTAAVADWRRRLAPLDEATAEAQPPRGIYEKILSRIGGTDNVVQLKRRIAAWRSAAIAVSALAASLLVFVALRGGWQVPQQSLYVAVLQGQDAAPAFVAAVDVKDKLMVVRRLGQSAPSDHSYELWALGAGRTAPQPLGVVEATARIPADRLDGGVLSDTTLAVSLEPEGGSPTGQPTGPVLFTGKLLSTD